MTARPTIYLAGPINGTTDAECFGWRERAARLLHAEGFDAHDPTQRDYRGRELESPDVVAKIVEDDLEAIAGCAAVLANLWRPSYGTAMELRYAAAELGLPVVAVWPHGANPSPWVVYHAVKVLPSLEAAAACVAREARLRSRPASKRLS